MAGHCGPVQHARSWGGAGGRTIGARWYLPLLRTAAAAAALFVVPGATYE